MINLRNQQKFGMINELKIRLASVENKNEQKVSVVRNRGQAPFFFSVEADSEKSGLLL